MTVVKISGHGNTRKDTEMGKYLFGLPIVVPGYDQQL